MTRFRFIPEKCTACGACAVACMDQKDIDTEAGGRAFCEVFRSEKNGRSEYISRICRHCTDAPCVDMCPMGCIYRVKSVGLTLIDDTDCVACGACAAACPYGAIQFSQNTGKMEKCDGCHARIAADMMPACIRACPFGALEIADEK